MRFLTRGDAGRNAESFIESVQHFTITMAVDLTQQTATISAVDTNLSSIFFGGFISNLPNDTSTACPRVELTNGTTVTAYRSAGTEDSSSTVVTGCVVTWKSTAVNSVQRGVINLAGGATSSTATISAVGANAVANYLGRISNITSLLPTIIECGVDLTNSTTVTATRGVVSAFNLFVGYEVIDFKAAVIQSVQEISQNYTNTNTSDNVTISSVVPANTILLFAGQYGISTTWADALHSLSLTGATTVNIARNSGGVSSRTINFTVIEFKAGVIASKQVNAQSWTTPATSDFTITAVTVSKTAVNNCGFLSNGTTTSNIFSSVQLLSTTALRYRKQGTTSTNILNAEAISFV